MKMDCFKHPSGLWLLTVLCLGLVARAAEPAPLMTRWGASLSPTNVLQEYPSPQFSRPVWQNLNGTWNYAIAREPQTTPKTFDGKILVPFPVESRLSGVARHLADQNTLWYQRRFSIPRDWNDQTVLLHFGAVDWSTTVYVNGIAVGSHQGGYDAFAFDVTRALKRDAPNELLVAVTDPTEGDQPRGKQSNKPEGIFYSAVSGIWQTVWLEPVPPLRLTALKIVPNLSARSVLVTPMANVVQPDVMVEVAVRFGDREVGHLAGYVGSDITVPLSELHPWNPNQPDLYDLVVSLKRGTNLLDQVGSYFGLREIRMAVDGMGVRRLFLNGRALFQLGVLDQGFWPEGLYTAPSDEAMRSDLEMAKNLGFNLVRKHVKVEPERWYYWADKLGLLVWQDMPSGNNATESGRRNFRRELERMMDQKSNHPSIVMWVLFNEGWGQFDTERLVRWMQSADPTRLVDNASGWTDAKVGDVIDAHSYPEPIAPVSDGSRACVLGEFGGLGLGVPGHMWSQQSWGYQGMPDSASATSRYVGLLDKVWKVQQASGLAAAVYTQLADVETECNGFLTYDREVLKMDPARVREANSRQPASSRAITLLGNGTQGEFFWRYTLRQPPEGWRQMYFDDSSWGEGLGGFGTKNTPGASPRTEWKTADIWLRRQFSLPESLPEKIRLIIHHDEDAEVYLNGVLAARLVSFTTNYEPVDILPEARAALRPGRNIIAIHCHQTTGGQFIDCGLLGEWAAP